MAKHEFRPDPDGGYAVVYEERGFPYCSYIECMRCDENFCDNNCDGDIFSAECPNGQLELFPLSEVL